MATSTNNLNPIIHTSYDDLTIDAFKAKNHNKSWTEKVASIVFRVKYGFRVCVLDAPKNDIPTIFATMYADAFGESDLTNNVLNAPDDWERLNKFDKLAAHVFETHSCKLTIDGNHLYSVKTRR